MYYTILSQGGNYLKYWGIGELLLPKVVGTDSKEKIQSFSFFTEVSHVRKLKNLKKLSLPSVVRSYSQ